MIQVGDNVAWLWNGEFTSGMVILIMNGLASVEVGDKSYYKCVMVDDLEKFHKNPWYYVHESLMERKRYTLYMWAANRIPEEFKKYDLSVQNLKKYITCWIYISDEEIVELSNRYDVFVRGTTKKVKHPYLFIDQKGKRFSQR